MTEPSAQAFVENRTFDEIQVGESASLERTLSKADIDLFAVMSGDVNPAHMDEEFAKAGKFSEVIAHGMWGGALISTVLGTQLPGPGTIYLGQSLRFARPVMLGDTVTVTVTALEKDSEKRHITFDCLCVNQNGQPVITGTADILVVPDLTSGNMLAKQLLYLADSQAAGIVLGARVPIVLTSRSDNLLRRLASCAVALLLAHHYRKLPP